MKIPVVYKHHSHGCAPTYTIKALERLGHETRRMTVEEYLTVDPKDFDLFFCQDSGEGIDFTLAGKSKLRKTSMWYWDSRFNRVQRTPGDDDMARFVIENGGWVFQAQGPDMERFSGVRMSYLPIAGDPYEWSNEPKEEKIYDLAFVGNCYDPGRAAAIERARPFGLIWRGPNTLFFEDAAKLYRQSKVVFHAPTFYGIPHDVTGLRIDYDVTMRYYEAFSCGVPVVTPDMPDFGRLGFYDTGGLFIYRTIDEVPHAITLALKAVADGIVDATKLRAFVTEGNSYEARMNAALIMLRSAGVC